MTERIAFVRRHLGRLWHTDRPLTLTGLLMTGATAAFVLGLLFDPSTITGAPAWLKPLKFSVSTAIYTLTLAWIFTFLPAWRRTRQVVGWITAVVIVAEVAIIAVQAWRGTSSHFNVSTPTDAALFGTMGTAIVLQTLASGFVAAALWRQAFDSQALGTALRAGMVITILGASSAGLMTRMTEAQRAELDETGRLATVGSHTVGAPDGGEGLPMIGWSADHGDLRIAHFAGLHALQLLPVIAFALRRRFADREAARAVRVAAASYSALVVILIVQALQGEALLQPGATTLAMLGTWCIATAAAMWLTTRQWKVRTESSFMGAM